MHPCSAPSFLYKDFAVGSRLSSRAFDVRTNRKCESLLSFCLLYLTSRTIDDDCISHLNSVGRASLVAVEADHIIGACIFICDSDTYNVKLQSKTAFVPLVHTAVPSNKCLYSLVLASFCIELIINRHWTIPE